MTDQRNILFINRDKDFLETMGESLHQAGYCVTTAMDMREALSALSSNFLGLIICDNRLKDVSGHDFLRFLKNDPLREKIPFIFCVPINDQGRAKEAFKSGADDFIVYPLKPDEIVSRVNEVYPSPLKPGTNKTIKPGSGNDSSNKKTQLDKEAEGRERRKDKRTFLEEVVQVEVSRNGILWVPGQIKNISVKGMLLKTSMLGKAGVEVYVRIPLESGTAVVKGSVKHIAFKNSNLSAGAGIGIEIEKNDQWNDFLKYIKSHIEKNKAATVSDKENHKTLQTPAGVEKTIIITKNSMQADDKKLPETVTLPKNKSASYNKKFYHSLIGKQLNNYKVVSFIGSGAMGGVFKGWDIALERPVALKVISYELSAQEKFREMFIKEARFVSRLDHPNIASIYHIGNENQILYFAMEFIEGFTLAEIIKREEHLNTLKGLEYLITICEALDFVSQQNIIHRDIKPANIMVNIQDVVKLVDFGVAKSIDVNENNKEGIVGSPHYISPDAFEERTLDQRSDIYSLGASFYHAFTGFRPFEGSTFKEIILKHLKEKPEPLKKRNTKVSGSTGKIIEKMMAKKPEDRYQDYRAIIKDLKALQSKTSRFDKIKNATLIFRSKK